MTETTRRDDSTDGETDCQTLGDVSHTPPNGTIDANRVFKRGGERHPATTDGGAERDASRRSGPDEDDDGEAVEA